MKSLRKLASQTVVYGLSSILGRFLNYLLVPLYTYVFAAEAYGVVSEFYAYAGFFAVLLGLGLETGYFRFRTRPGVGDSSAYGAALGVLIPANLLFLGLVIAYREPLAIWLRYPEHPEYLVWFSLILATDAICALPFARLRAKERAIRFAAIKLTEILLTMGLNLLFILGFPAFRLKWPEFPWDQWLDPEIGVGAIFLANLIGSAAKWVLLLPEFRHIDFVGGLRLVRPMLRYALPMVIIGFAGMINEMLDRAILKYLLPFDLSTNLRMLGVYGACYKLSILMTLFVQAFRYAGEPFFFAMAGRSDARQAYALVMRYFVVCCSGIYLGVVLFLDVFKYFIGEEYREGLGIVPILLMANLFLGIYINLSIWYKLTDRTGWGGLGFHSGRGPDGCAKHRLDPEVRLFRFGVGHARLLRFDGDSVVGFGPVFLPGALSCRSDSRVSSAFSWADAGAASRGASTGLGYQGRRCASDERLPFAGGNG